MAVSSSLAGVPQQSSGPAGPLSALPAPSSGVPRLHVQGSVNRAYVIGLGANLGDRLGSVRAAIRGLETLGRLLATSGLYETDPLGPPQPDYLNAAVLLESQLSPRLLLAGLLAIEREQGRERRERWGPRTLDLDLLYSPGLLLDESGLTVPHPALTERAFALLPLIDVAPEAIDPRTGSTYRELSAALDLRQIRRVEAGGPGRAEWAR